MDRGIVTDRSLRRGMYLARFAGDHLILFELLAHEPLSVGTLIEIPDSHMNGPQDIVRFDRWEKARVCVENNGGTPHMLDPFR